MGWIQMYSNKSLADISEVSLLRGDELEFLKLDNRLVKIKETYIRDLFQKWYDIESNRHPQNKKEFKKSIRDIHRLRLEVFCMYKKVYANIKTDNCDINMERALKIIDPYWKKGNEFIKIVNKRWDRVNPEKRTLKRFIKHFEASEVRGEKIARSAMNRLYNEWMQPSQVRTNEMRNIDLKNALLKKGVKLNKIMGIYKFHIKQIKDL